MSQESVHTEMMHVHKSAYKSKMFCMPYICIMRNGKNSAFIGQGPSIVLYLASRKMFAECTFSRRVAVLIIRQACFAFIRQACFTLHKMFARGTLCQWVVVFDYQASVFCICKNVCKTYVVLMSHVGTRIQKKKDSTYHTYNIHSNTPR